jgi:jumonji domain-containing protein 7
MDPVVELLTSYADLNAPCLVELESEPSALQFMRFVALNTPFIVKNATVDWRSTKLWSSSYFRTVLKGQVVNVAVTPSGYVELNRYWYMLQSDTFIGMPILLPFLQMDR